MKDKVLPLLDPLETVLREGGWENADEIAIGVAERQRDADWERVQELLAAKDAEWRERIKPLKEALRPEVAAQLLAQEDEGLLSVETVKEHIEEGYD